MPDPQTLPALVRAKYPGQYDDLSDADLDAKVRAKYPGVYDDIPKPTVAKATPTLTGLNQASGIGPEPTTLERMGAAVGPAIRGAGDVTGANWFLEKTGLVPEGRLRGPEQNTRDAATRDVAGTGGTAMMVGQGVSAVVDSATAKGLSMAQRGIAAAKAAGQQITPQLKYEFTKRSLQAVGVPAPIAFATAAMVAGYSKAPVKPGEAPHVPTAEGYQQQMPNVSAPSAGYGESAAGVQGTVVEPHAPNVSEGPSADYGPSASDVQGSLAEPHAPNVSTAVPTQAPPAHWAEHLAANPDAWRVDPYMPNVSGGKIEYAPPMTPVSGHLQVDPHMPNVSTLTPEQLAAQAAVHNAAVAPEAALPVSGPQGVPASAQVPSSFAALLRPPSPAQLANAEGLVARGRSLADAARTVSRGDAELGARIMTALQASHK